MAWFFKKSVSTISHVNNLGFLSVFLNQKNSHLLTTLISAEQQAKGNRVFSLHEVWNCMERSTHNGVVIL